MNPNPKSLPRLIAFAALFLPGPVFAAPATVRVFEAPVHSAPDRSSPVIHTFAENARVSVSEDVTNGFRRVRLPNGSVGYIEQSAIALAAPAMPPERPPPPPPFAAPPPPPPPPPPGAYPYPYRRRVYRDPTAFRHAGLFLRLNLGLGYMSSSAPADRTFFTFDSSRGFAGDLGFALGGTPRENFIVAGEFWSTWAASPTLRSQGATVPSGSTFSNSLHGVGPNLTWYWMPSNTYASVTPSLTWMNFGDVFGSFTTDVGFGTRFALGKEWWVGPHWGIGVSSWFVFSLNREGGGSDATWRTFEGGLAFSATLN